jgi:hypothetical protein
MERHCQQHIIKGLQATVNNKVWSFMLGHLNFFQGRVLFYFPIVLLMEVLILYLISCLIQYSVFFKVTI